MNLKKFMSVAALSIFALSITACTQDTESAFHKNLDLGYYQGMHITWIKDDANTSGIGFYVIDDAHVDTSKQNNSDFEEEKFVGKYGDLKILWVRDHTNAKSKGFYLFKDKDNHVVSSLTLAQTFKSGKTTTVKNIGTVFTSSMSNPALQVQLDDKAYEETVKVSELSSAQLIQLSQRLLEAAKDKQLENNHSDNNSLATKPRF